VIGGGGHAKVLISVLRKLGWDFLGYTDERDRGTILGSAWLGGDERLATLVADHPGCAALIGVGKVDAGRRRLELQHAAAALGYALPVVVSPAAIVNEGVLLGAGSMVFDGAVVNGDAAIGEGCILNTGSIVEHDCVVGVDVHVAPGATVCGGSRVGDHCMLGAGATVVHAVSVCAKCVIGAGAAVVGDITEPGVYVGVPARRIA
jgi:sugar O-acyltransferase (sialic acid O-acetyltransferase NeuD family)